MKYHQIERNLFIKNRAKFMAQMKPKVLPFYSNDIYPISADSTMPFAQHTMIFYLGRRSRGKHLLLFQMLLEHQREILF
jgi:Xaa-Pro aminopeptidase